jgi:manganese transport protein
MDDPYALRSADVTAPPRTLLGGFWRLGPGIVLAATIVGSGELIVTTSLGARVGYSALWLVLLSCAVKPVIQAELGRYTLASGETGLQALNRVPGPRLRVNWLVWVWALMAFLCIVQAAGMLGVIAHIAALVMPAVPVWIWTLGFSGLTLSLLLRGDYEFIERLAMFKVAFFTVLTLVAAGVLIGMPEFFTWTDALDGLRFHLPTQGWALVIALFGVTGVGANELFMYPYWCIEKGYARFVGRRDDTEEWGRRARGWVRVMQVDIGLSFLVYTAVTAAFYVLGAGVLHRLGQVPAEDNAIGVLSLLYTRTLGPWALWVFYAEALVVLYGTLFAGTAGNALLYADFCRLLGFFEAGDHERRMTYRRGFVTLLTLVPAGIFLALGSPIRLIVAGGVLQTLLLPIIGAGTLYLHHRHLPRAVAPSRLVTLALWTATSILSAIAIGTLWHVALR